MAFKKGDFIELDYTGRLKESGKVFDTTLKEVVEKEDLPKQETYEPAIIILGEHQLLPGLEEFLEGKEPGTYAVELTSEKAFGKKDAKLLRLIPMKLFKKENISPFPGLDVTVDNKHGIIRTVNGGRVIVDFNHPLSGQDVAYDLDVKRVVDDKKEQVQAVLKTMGLSADVTLEENKAVITLKHELTKELEEQLAKPIERLAAVQVEFKKQ
ncbi:MAG: peptidylprolyl isomerase [archaeon]